MALIVGLILFATIFYFAFLRKAGESKEQSFRKIAITVMVLVVLIVIVLVLGAKGYLG